MWGFETVSEFALRTVGFSFGGLARLSIFCEDEDRAESLPLDVTKEPQGSFGLGELIAPYGEKAPYWCQIFSYIKNSGLLPARKVGDQNDLPPNFYPPFPYAKESSKQTPIIYSL